MLKPVEIYSSSSCCRFFRAVREAWHHSAFARWLRREPVWLTGKSGFVQLTWSAAVPAGWRSRAAQGLHNTGTFAGSSLLRTIVKNAWLLLFPLGAYPLIDYALRRGEIQGGLAGTWDELLLLAGLVLVAVRIAYRGLGTYRYTELEVPLFVYFGVFLFLFLIRSPETAVGIEGVRVYLEYIFWFFVGTGLLDTGRQARVFLAWFVFVCTVVALYGIGQYIAGVPVPSTWLDQAEAGVRTRAFSVIGSPNVLGSLLALCLPLSIAGFYTAGCWRRRAGYALAAAAMALCLVFTFSRGAWLAVFLGLVLFALISKPGLLWALGAAVLLAPVASPGITGRLLYLFSFSYLASSYRSGRIARWQAALERLSLHPLAGEGFGRFGGAVATRAIPGSFYVDNFYLKTAAEGGLIGLATFLWVIFAAWRAGYRAVRAAAQPASKMFAAACLGGLTAVLLHNFVENIFETPLMSTLFWLLLGVLVALPHLPAEEGRD
ncbi:MAG: O-antigen ligase family protein [Bacillota bacterium]